MWKSSDLIGKEFYFAFLTYLVGLWGRLIKFPSLVYFYQFSFQFNLEKCRGDAGVWFGCFCFFFKKNSLYSFRVTQHSEKGCELQTSLSLLIFFFFSRGSWSGEKSSKLSLFSISWYREIGHFFLEPQSQTWASEGMCALSYRQYLIYNYSGLQVFP